MIFHPMGNHVTIFSIKSFSGFHSLVYPLFISKMIYSYTRTYNCDNAVRGPPTLSQSLFRFFSSLSRALLLATRLFSQFIGDRKNNSLDTYSKPRCTNLFSDFNLTLTKIYRLETFSFQNYLRQHFKTHGLNDAIRFSSVVNRWKVTAERNSCIACLNKIIAINWIIKVVRHATGTVYRGRAWFHTVLITLDFTTENNCSLIDFDCKMFLFIKTRTY